MDDPVTSVRLRSLPAGAAFVFRGNGGGVLTRGHVVGPGAAGGVFVAIAHSFETEDEPRHTEWTGALLVERAG